MVAGIAMAATRVPRQEWRNRNSTAVVSAIPRFDFFIFPGQQHGYGNMSDYWFWLRAEYFVKHLLGDTRWRPDIVQLNVEQEQTSGR